MAALVGTSVAELRLLPKCRGRKEDELSGLPIIFVISDTFVLEVGLIL